MRVRDWGFYRIIWWYGKYWNMRTADGRPYGSFVGRDVHIAPGRPISVYILMLRCKFGTRGAHCASVIFWGTALFGGAVNVGYMRTANGRPYGSFVGRDVHIAPGMPISVYILMLRCKLGTWWDAHCASVIFGGTALFGGAVNVGYMRTDNGRPYGSFVGRDVHIAPGMPISA